MEASLQEGRMGPRETPRGRTRWAHREKVAVCTPHGDASGGPACGHLDLGSATPGLGANSLVCGSVHSSPSRLTQLPSPASRSWSQSRGGGPTCAAYGWPQGPPSYPGSELAQDFHLHFFWGWIWRLCASAALHACCRLLSLSPTQQAGEQSRGMSSLPLSSQRAGFPCSSGAATAP